MIMRLNFYNCVSYLEALVQRSHRQHGIRGTQWNHQIGTGSRDTDGKTQSLEGVVYHNIDQSEESIRMDRREARGSRTCILLISQYESHRGNPNGFCNRAVLKVNLIR